jgi:hypothetical protein
MKKYHWPILICFLLFRTILCAQHIRHQIELKNPSFESLPGESITPLDWENCDKVSSPDVLPGPWGVKLAPQDGISYLGLVVREDNTQEFVVQELSVPLRPKTCYQFTISLATSASYVGYERPAVLRVWGSNSKCEKEVLLGVSSNIVSNNWQEEIIGIYTEKAFKYIIFEAYYKQPSLYFYKGNLLLDNTSILLECERV